MGGIFSKCPFFFQAHSEISVVQDSLLHSLLLGLTGTGHIGGHLYFDSKKA